MQGTFVGEGQSHTRSYGPGFQRGVESREITEQNGNRYINQLSRALNIPESASKAAGQVFKLAVGLNFIQGRRTKTVAAVCLYIACRRQNGNTVMLIDFADVLMINVFKLGRTYKALLDELRLGGNVFLMNPIDPESLIYRFAKQLEFGPSTMQVASEAVRIVQRMNRDWMTTGRRPAGVCGAALILAARMNNFRRTVREVVYVVKVTEITINQRLNEFSSTESGDLTVDQFRSVQLENAHDPPSFTRAREGRKPSRGVKRKKPETAAEIEGDTDAQPTPPQSRRLDADGFAIPDLPIDPALTTADDNHQKPSISTAINEVIAEVAEEASSSILSSSKDGRPKGSKRKPLPEPTAEQLASEEALEDEMTALLSKDSNMVNSMFGPDRTGQTQLPEQQQQQPKNSVSETTEIDASEFESDPEVANCLLSPAEVELKERIWVHENRDYLRTQQAKALKRALLEADRPAGAAHKPRKRRRGRLGDVAYLEGDGEDGEGRSTRAATPAEATRRMLERRGFSKKINYRLLESLYGEEEKEDEGETKLMVKNNTAKTRTDMATTPGRSSRSRSRSLSVVSNCSANEGPAKRARLLSNISPAKPVLTAASPSTSIAPATTTGDEPASASQQRPTTEQIGESKPPAEQGGDGDDYNDEDDDYDDEDDEDDEDDGVDAAFAGTYGDYYDEGSDYGSD